MKKGLLDIVSLLEKGNLRKDLERWLNKKFLLAELKVGIDLESLIGKNATLFITHNEKEERSYANIETILPPEKDPKTGKPAWYGIEPISDYIRVIDRPEYQSPKEYATQKKSA